MPRPGGSIQTTSARCKIGPGSCKSCRNSRLALPASVLQDASCHVLAAAGNQAWCATHATTAKLPYRRHSLPASSIRTGPRQHRPIEGQLHEQHVYRRAPRREGIVATPALTSHLGQPLITRRCQLTCLPRLHRAWNRLGSVALNPREIEREYIEAVLLRALLHDSSTC